mgnify:FL=1
MDGWIASVPGKGCFVCGIPGATQKQQKELLNTFDRTAGALLALGLTRQELISRLE